jgi:hypothetical protein
MLCWLDCSSASHLIRAIQIPALLLCERSSSRALQRSTSCHVLHCVQSESSLVCDQLLLWLCVPSDPNTSLPFFSPSLVYLSLSFLLLFHSLPLSFLSIPLVVRLLTWVHSIRSVRMPLRVLDTQRLASNALRARAIGHTKSTLTCRTLKSNHSSISPKQSSSMALLVFTTRQ